MRRNPLTPDVEATLLKLRKHVTTGLSTKKVAAAYAVLGIKELECVTVQPLRDLEQTFWSLNDEAAVRRWMKNVEVVRQAPAKPVEGRIYSVTAPVFTLRTVHGSQDKSPEASVPAGSGVGTPTKVRTVPGTAPLVFVRAIRWDRDGTFKAQDYWNAVDRTLHQVQEDRIAELASRALGLSTPAEEKHQKKATAAAEKVAKGGGICGVCFKAHKIYDYGATYPHGYKMNTRGGRGHQGSFKTPGQCAGAQAQCWERGPQTTLRHAADLRRWAQANRTLLEEVKAGRHPDIHVAWRPAATKWHPDTWRLVEPYDLLNKGETRGVLQPGDAAYADADKKRRLKYKQEADSLDASAAWFEKAAAGWPTLPRD